MTLAERLTPELENQIVNTRKILTALPDGSNDFRPHVKSMALDHLAGHVTEILDYPRLILKAQSLNMGTPEDQRKVVRLSTTSALIHEFEVLANEAVKTLKSTTDAAFDETFTLLHQGHTVMAASRYDVYRQVFMNHLIHHRAQLGVYLRLLNLRVPATFGTSADE